MRPQGLLVAIAAPAQADELTRASDISAAVDSYLANDSQDAALVGGPGSAGYDNGFYIRGGDFSLNINATLQARWEGWAWDDATDAAAQFGNVGVFAGDTSGFSLPLATLKFSGEAPCNICWYMELEFGHHGRFANENRVTQTVPQNQFPNGDNALAQLNQTNNFDGTREAWIEWCNCDAFNFRMGQIATPTTRQLMVAEEKQQFVDISLASAWQGLLMPGFTSRKPRPWLHGPRCVRLQQRVVVHDRRDER